MAIQWLIVKWLAVAGGVAVGFFGGGLLLIGLCRATVHRRPPQFALRITRLLGGIALGWLVYLWAFGIGTSGGLGGGGGWWPFGSQGGPGTAERQSNSESPDVVKEESPLNPTSVQVRVLGGKEVVEQRFYVVQNEPRARKWNELVDALTELRNKDANLRIVEIILYPESVDRDNPAVRDLEAWAHDHGMTPKVSTPPVPREKTKRAQSIISPANRGMRG
jgi:hypothetical protein